MTTFDDRETAFEAKFAHDEEMRFRAVSRRNRIVGLWAAGLLGKAGAEADAYAAEVMHADFETAGDEDVVRKLSRDLGSKASDATILRQIQVAMTEAQRQLLDEAG